MDPLLLADAIVVAHLGYVAFVVVGLLLVWLGVLARWEWVRRPWFRVPHLVCTLIVPVEALVGYVCPLTRWERDLRREAGQMPEEISFVARLAREALFYQAPDWVFTVCYVAFGLATLATLLRVPIRRRRAAAV